MSRKPLDKDLYDSVVAEAKRKFDVWPSAYASGWVVKTYKARGGRYGGESKGSRTGLTKWFGESWVDISRPIREGGEVVGYEPCGRKKSGDPADYPKCRPAKEAMRMTPSEVRDAIKRKRAAEAKVGRGGRGARAPVRVATYRENPRLYEYQGEHLPPGPDDGAPLHDVESVMPDYYAHPEWYFTEGRTRREAEAAAAILAARGRPWASVWVYRAVPPGVSTINPGDWVTTVRDYAKEHLDSNLGGEGRILKAKVRAGSLFTEGNSHMEWGWWPDAEREREFERLLRERRQAMARDPDVRRNNPDNSVVAALRETLREIDAADEYLSEHGDTDPASELCHIDDFGRCTTTAEYIAQKHGGAVFGYHTEGVEGADERVGADVGGHDFALIDGRYIVDWWGRSYEGHPYDIVDLKDPQQRTYALEKYGDPTTWDRVSADEDADEK